MRTIYPRNMSQRRAAGFSLLELVAVIVIIAILATVVLGRLGGGNAKAKAGNEKDIFVDAYNGMTEMKANGTYGAVGTDLMPTLIARQTIAKAWAVTGTTVTNIYSGGVSAISNGNTATLTTNQESPEACIAIVHAANTMSGASISVNSSTVTMPISDSDATNACNKTGNNNVVAVTAAS